MTIGEALKKSRNSLGLTQSQFAHDVVSESFYSKVERGINEITATDLLKLLQVNHINIVDFLAEIEDETNNNLQEDLKIQLLDAYSSRDKEKISKLNKKNQKSSCSTDVKISSLLINAVVNDKVKDLNVREKNQIKKRFLEVDEWTKNITTLQLFCNSMIIFNLDELELLMKELEHTYRENLGKYPFNIQRIIASICINYFRNCYTYSKYEKASIGFKLIDRLAKIPDLGIYLIVTNFYRAFFNDNQRKCKEILNFLDENNLREVSLRLP